MHAVVAHAADPPIAGAQRAAEAFASQIWIFVGDARDLEWPGEVVG